MMITKIKLDFNSASSVAFSWWFPSILVILQDEEDGVYEKNQ